MQIKSAEQETNMKCLHGELTLQYNIKYNILLPNWFWSETDGFQQDWKQYV